MLAVDSAVVALHVLSSPGMPKALYLEELVLDLVNLLKYQLQYNALVFYDDRLSRAWRGAAEGAWRLPAAARSPARPAGWLAGRLEGLEGLAGGDRG
jgi:hypothetical protein